MTMTEPGNIWEFFDLLGVPHLERFLDEGANFVDLDLTEEEVRSLASTAAVRWYGPPVLIRSGNGWEAMAGLYFHFVSSVMAGENLTEHSDGTITIPGIDGEAMEVTDHRIRHWQWMLMLFTQQHLADRFLAAVPERIRAGALARAASQQKELDGRFIEQVFGGGTDGR